MTLVYFLRHGLAENKKDWPGDDDARPLTPDGQRHMETEAEMIAKLELQIETVLTSPLARAAQTADIVARRLQLTDKLIPDKRLAPGFGPNQLARILADYQAATALMLVGHEPDFSETIREVIGGGRVVVKKGGLACIEVQPGKAVKGRLLWLVPPQFLAP